MRKLIRYRRAVSPVITTVFLMAIIISAIAFALGIIFPNLEKLNEQVSLESNTTNLVSLDQNLRGLMLNGQDGKIFLSMDLGNGFLLGDNKSSSIIGLKYRTYDITGNLINDTFITGGPSLYNGTQYRLVIRQEITNTDLIPNNAYQYLAGSGFQNLFYLNSTTRATMPWVILNQSRFAGNYVYTQLSYRNLITIDKVVDSFNLRVNITISVQRVKFIWSNNINTTSTLPLVTAEYGGLNVTTFDWIKIANAGINSKVFYIETTNNMWNLTTIQTPQINQEYPFKHDVPDDGFLFVRMQFIDHLITLGY